jgi:hypothetical protein
MFLISLVFMIAFNIVNNLLSDSQYDFRPGRSCAIQLLEILDEWPILLNSFNPVGQYTGIKHSHILQTTEVKLIGR